MIQVGIFEVTDSVNIDASPLPATRLNFAEATPKCSDKVMQMQPHEPAQLLSLWDWYSQHKGLHLQTPATNQLGSYVFSARLTENASQPQGTCCLSGSLTQHFDSQEHAVALFRTPQLPAAMSASNASQATRSSKQDVVYARMLLDTVTGKLCKQQLCLTVFCLPDHYWAYDHQINMGWACQSLI